MIASSTGLYCTAHPGRNGTRPPTRTLTKRRPQLRLAQVFTATATTITVVFVLAWVIPMLPAALHDIGHAHAAVLLVAVLFQFASLLAAARLQRAFVAAAGVRVSLRESLRTTLASTALSSLLPGGSVMAVAYTARRMRGWGAAPLLIGYAVTVTGLLSTATLGVIAATGGLLQHSLFGGGNPWLRAAQGVATAVALLVAVVAGGRLLTRPAVVRRTGDMVIRLARHLPRRLRRDGASVSVHVDAAVTAVQSFGAGMPWARATLFAAVNWVDDMLCLLLTCYALGIHPSPQTLVVGYVAAKTATSAVPLLPGGIGAVEAVLLATLRHAGAAAAAAAAAVLLYRLISFGLVSLAGAVALARPGSSTAPTVLPVQLQPAA